MDPFVNHNDIFTSSKKRIDICDIEEFQIYWWPFKVKMGFDSKLHRKPLPGNPLQVYFVFAMMHKFFIGACDLEEIW